MATLDPDQRAEVIKQMQEVMYEDCPCVVYAHPYRMSAYRTDTWTGWQRANYGAGAPFLTQAIPFSYQNIEPKSTEDEGSNLGLWVGIIAAVVVVGIIVVVLVMRGRRGGPAVEE